MHVPMFSRQAQCVQLLKNSLTKFSVRSIAQFYTQKIVEGCSHPHGHRNNTLMAKCKWKLLFPIFCASPLPDFHYFQKAQDTDAE